MSTVNFTIDVSFGDLLLNIAKEKLIKTYSLKDSISILTESLIGCSDEIAFKILNGNFIIKIDSEKQDIFLEKSEINFLENFINESINSFNYDIIDSLKILNNLIKHPEFDIAINLSDIYNDNFPEIITHVKNILKAGEDLINKFKKFLILIDEVEQKLNIKFSIGNITKDISNLNIILQKIKSNSIDSIENKIDDYIECALKSIKSIKPVNIMDNYSAGWLSPEGLFYGMNGTYANMLHNKIADLLFNELNLPIEFENNPDLYLSSNGWVRIHGNSILYDGYMSESIKIITKEFYKKEFSLTKIQVEILFNYIHTLHKDSFKTINGFFSSFMLKNAFEFDNKNQLLKIFSI